MAGKSESEKEIAELIRQAGAARSELGAQAAKLRDGLDVPARLRSSLSGHPARWMAGSLVSGMAASLLFRRKPKPAPGIQSKRAWLAILAMLTAVAKPLVKEWLLARLKDLLAGHHHPTPVTRPVPRPLP
jgi:hypothetical protein